MLLPNYPLFEFQLLDSVNFFLDVSDLPTLIPPLVPLPIISLSSALETNVIDGLAVFSIEISVATILLKP